MKKMTSTIMTVMLALLLVVSFSFIGCKEEAAPAAEEEAVEEVKEEVTEEEVTEEEEIIVGRVLLFTIDEYQKYAGEVAQQFADERGVKLLLDAFELDLEVERQLVEDYIAQGADVIILQGHTGADTDEMNKLARENDVPFVAWYVEPTVEPYTFCGVDEKISSTEMGVQAANLWKELHPDIPIKIGALVQEQSESIMEIRPLAFIEGVHSVEPDAPVIMQQMTDEAALDKVQADFEDMMTANPDINMICTMSSATALVGHNALQAMGRGTTETEIVCSWNGDINEYLKMMDPESSYRFTVGMSPYTFEKLMWDTAFKLLNGEISMDETNKFYSGCMVLTGESKDWKDYIEREWGKNLEEAVEKSQENQ